VWTGPGAARGEGAEDGRGPAFPTEGRGPREPLAARRVALDRDQLDDAGSLRSVPEVVFDDLSGQRDPPEDQAIPHAIRHEWMRGEGGEELQSLHRVEPTTALLGRGVVRIRALRRALGRHPPRLCSVPRARRRQIHPPYRI
jgi:hypothetical protein